MTKEKTSTSKRHASQAWAAAYGGLVGTPLLPTMPRPPRRGYAWDSEGREVPLVRAWVRQKVGVEEEEELLEGIEVSDVFIIEDAAAARD